MDNLDTAVLFLVFNRLDITKQSFLQIKKAKPKRFYIACDGARSNRPGEDILVSELREYLLANIDWECEVKTLFRDANLGCGRAVSEGITWFFQHEPMGIILEDDCIASLSFFNFCQELLNKYQLDKRIWQISGSSFLKPEDLPESSYYFSSMSQIWGWATWRDRWSEYDFHMKKYNDFDRRNYLDGIANTLRIRLWHKHLFEDNLGKTSNWDCQWYFTTLVNHGLCVTPRINLVKNIGFDLVESTHSHGADRVLSAMTNNEIDFPLTHPDVFCIDTNLDMIYYKWRTRNGVFLKLIAKPIRKLDEIFFNKKIINFYKRIFVK